MIQDSTASGGPGLTTDKFAAAQTAALLVSHGVRHAVISPGSRNAPLIVALSRQSGINCLSVIDERSAAFVALGLAVQSGEPVAVVCTSGTALLNFAPAVAEAFYRRVPLIVISADRPSQWIDQDDSQTIVQPGSLSNIVKLTHDIPSDADMTPDGRWLANRLVNDALLTAMEAPRGPVHINLRLDAPLNGLAKAPENLRVINSQTSRPDLTVSESRMLASRLAPPCRVLVVAGFAEPSHRMSRAMSRLSAIPNVAVLTENIANIHADGALDNIDMLLASLTPEQKRDMMPDVVITTGGALVSRFVKEWLRSSPVTMQHWHVGRPRTTVDCFRRLTLRVDMDADTFMSQLASALTPFRDSVSDYGARFREAHKAAMKRAESYGSSAPWSDFTAFRIMTGMIPPSVNLHLSNGTPIRYAQLFDCSRLHRVNCNRGVSGIDGSTSTALGAAIAYKGGQTLLITGDMSAQYDIAALTSKLMPSRLKIVVMDNGGGGIFRFIASTRSLPEVEERFACAPLVGQRWDLIAPAFGLTYFEASDAETLTDAFEKLLDCPNAALLSVKTDSQMSAETLTGYFDYLKNQNI